MVAATILDFKILFLTIRTVKKGELRHCAKFCRNRSNHGGDYVSFRFFKMADAATLDFWNFKFLTVRSVKSFEMYTFIHHEGRKVQ